MGYHVWNLYTPWGRFTVNLPQGEYDLQMDWHIEQLQLKFTLPLCSIWFNLSQRMCTFHVKVSCRLIHLKITLSLHYAHSKYPPEDVCNSQRLVYFTSVCFYAAVTCPCNFLHLVALRSALWYPHWNQSKIGIDLDMRMWKDSFASCTWETPLYMIFNLKEYWAPN